MGEEGKHYVDLRLRVNGEEHALRVEPQETLLEVVRNRLGLTGTKLSCDMEVCGACTVLLDGKPVSSCTTLAFEARGKEVLTIEGVSRNGKLHPIQEAFIEKGGLQCGFCTPGMILTAKAFLEENPDPTEEEVKEYMHGNLCRCTGYGMIVESILAAAEKMRGRK
jgi:aerobic-type carbon monoxide dehydrogenase small subunit (CoxS/CutS family)